jgi:hypothetical protein
MTSRDQYPLSYFTALLLSSLLVSSLAVTFLLLLLVHVFLLLVFFSPLSSSYLFSSPVFSIKNRYFLLFFSPLFKSTISFFSLSSILFFESPLLSSFFPDISSIFSPSQPRIPLQLLTSATDFQSNRTGSFMTVTTGILVRTFHSPDTPTSRTLRLCTFSTYVIHFYFVCFLRILIHFLCQ